MTMTPGTGLVINASYDSSVSNAPSGLRTKVAAVVLHLEDLFTDQITINISGNAASPASITGRAGSVIAIAYGATNFQGGAGAATVAAFGGSTTIIGSSGIGVFLGGPTGNNRITAGTDRTTMIGGGNGDVLQPGPGQETLLERDDRAYQRSSRSRRRGDS